MKGVGAENEKLNVRFIQATLPITAKGYPPIWGTVGSIHSIADYWIISMLSRRFYSPKPGQIALTLATILGLSYGTNQAIASASTPSPTPSHSSLLISQATNTQADPSWAEGTSSVITYTQTQGGHDRPVRAVAFSPDRQFLVTSGGDRTIKVWDTRNLRNDPGNPARVQNIVVNAGDREIVSLAFSPDGSLLASGSLNGTVRLWNWRTGQLVHTLSGHSDIANSLSFTPDGQTLASGSGDNTIRFWDVNTGDQKYLLTTGQAVNKIAFSPDGATLAVTGADRMGSLWEWQEEEEPILTSRVYARSIQTLAFSPDGQLLAFSPDMQSPAGPVPEGNREDYNTIHLLDAEDFSEVGEPLRGHSDYITGLTFSPSGHLIASASLDGTVRLWDIEQQRLVRTFQGNTSAVLSVAFRPDGRALAIGRRDGSVSIFLSRE
ncbi:WD40 repeat domain-containing protein [Leptolyngbya sp. FACHB-16]|uniref:WD40 repeat domain-containing protein n=2 Tax=Leptolyngbya TaxID=47251 RepID=UPI0016893CDA|nr:WD40 repeat domain-containing protein [Leptolyngbya sp. FACHB-16]